MKTNLLTIVREKLEEMKAVDAVILDVRNKTTVTDHIIIATGTSGRHVRAIAQEVVMASKKNKNAPLGVEGMDIAEWVLVDLGDIVVHVFQKQIRAFYMLEELWGGESSI